MSFEFFFSFSKQSQTWVSKSSFAHEYYKWGISARWFKKIQGIQCMVNVKSIPNNTKQFPPHWKYVWKKCSNWTYTALKNLLMWSKNPCVISEKLLKKRHTGEMKIFQFSKKSSYDIDLQQNQLFIYQKVFDSLK